MRVSLKCVGSVCPVLVKLPCRSYEPPISFSFIVSGLWFMSIKVRSIDITVNFLYCGHCRDLKLVFSLARVRDSKSFSRTFVICSCRGFRCCPYYWGVRKARVDCILFHLWINTKTIKRDKFTKEQKLLEEICLQ